MDSLRKHWADATRPNAATAGIIGTVSLALLFLTVGDSARRVAALCDHDALRCSRHSARSPQPCEIAQVGRRGDDSSARQGNGKD